MNPILLSIFAVMALAAQHTILGRMHFTAEATLLTNLTLGAVGIILCTFTGGWPKGGEEWSMLVTTSVFLLIGGYLLGVAYASPAARVVAITTILALLPVFAAIINWVTGGGLPTAREVTAAVFAMASVVLLTWKA